MKVSSLALVGILLLATNVSSQSQAVDIYYDPFSVPHVFGETDEAVMFGLGYQQMRDFPIGTLDRLWRFSGRFAEVAGPSYLDQDYRLRLWQVPEILEREKANLDIEYRRLLDAYVRGIEAGRAWWSNGNTPPTSSLRLRTIMGTTADPNNVEMHIDPLPDYLNQGFHPFQYHALDPGIIHPNYDPALVPTYITLVLDRLFDPSNAISVDHVLSLSIVRRSPFYTAAERRFVPDDTFPAQVERWRRLREAPADASYSKAWGISSSAAGGVVVTHQDGHTGRDTLTQRPYVVQIHGDRYRVAGLSHPGLPYIAIGFNDFVSRCGAGEGTNRGVSGSTWEVTLQDREPLRFRFGARAASSSPKPLARFEPPPAPGAPTRTHFHRLQRVDDALFYFDPAASLDTDASGAVERDEWVIGVQIRERYYAPDPAGLGFPDDRYPVVEVNGNKVDGIGIVPRAGDTISFAQDAFTTSGCTGEYYFRMGRVHYIDNAPAGEDQVIDILDADLGVYNNNLFFADYRDRFYAIVRPKAAIQGPGIAARFSTDDYNRISGGKLVLDGHLPGDRWQGFHTRNALPQIGPVDVTGPESWIVVNTTLDRVDARLTEADLANYSPDVIRPESVATWPYVRAEDLLMQGQVPVDGLAGRTEEFACDVVEIQTLLLWPFLEQARDVRSLELGSNANVDRFVQWINVYRHLADDGLTCDPANFDFVAHPYAVVLPYTTLLLAWYSQELRQIPGLTELQASFGTDPVHPLFTLGTIAFDRPAYDPNIDAMWNALVATAELWSAGTGAQGLQNKDVLVNQWGVEPWSSDPRHADTQEFLDQNSLGCGLQTFASDMDGTDLIRWGHVNMLVLTPHFLQPTPSGPLGTDTDLNRSLPTAGLRPDLLGSLDPGGSNRFISRLKFPVYENQTPLAYPVSGTANTLFPAGNKVVSFSGPFDGYNQALYAWSTSPDSFFSFVPHERGAQQLIIAELHDPPGARGRFLSTTSGTEITRPFLPHQDRFATSADFASGTWQDLETIRSVVEANAIEHLQLTFTPAPAPTGAR